MVVWPAVVSSTKYTLMFLCVTWHSHWYIKLLYVADSYVAYCSVVVWRAVAGSTKCILMILCVKWHSHWYIKLLCVADSYVAYCSVAVWPVVAGSSKCILMFLCVTWHRHWYIYIAAECSWWLYSILQCGCVTCCSWQYKMYTDVPLCHMTQTLIYIAAVCSWWLYSIFNNCVDTQLTSCITEVTLEMYTE